MKKIKNPVADHTKVCNNSIEGDNNMVMSEASKERKKKYDTEYHKKTRNNLMFNFILGKDDDVVERIKSMPNKVEYIRRLVREDMEKEKGGQ